jgi:hypothetical protein
VSHAARPFDESKLAQEIHAFLRSLRWLLANPDKLALDGLARRQMPPANDCDPSVTGGA